MRFDAFVSYSQKDKKFAVWLQRQLESFRLPRASKTARNKIKLFRDETDLTGSGDLTEALKQALKDSRFLIVICSRAGAGSYWVNLEIETFINMHGLQNVLPIFIDGLPYSSDDRIECVPAALKSATSGKAHAYVIDASETKKRRLASQRLAAAIADVPLDEFVNRERKRRNQAVGLSVSGGFIALVVAFGVVVSAIEYNRRERMLQNAADMRGYTRIRAVLEGRAPPGSLLPETNKDKLKRLLEEPEARILLAAPFGYAGQGGTEFVVNQGGDKIFTRIGTEVQEISVKTQKPLRTYALGVGVKHLNGYTPVTWTSFSVAGSSAAFQYVGADDACHVVLFDSRISAFRWKGDERCYPLQLLQPPVLGVQHTSSFEYSGVGYPLKTHSDALVWRDLHNQVIKIIKPADIAPGFTDLQTFPDSPNMLLIADARHPAPADQAESPSTLLRTYTPFTALALFDLTTFEVRTRREVKDCDEARCDVNYLGDDLVAIASHRDGQSEISILSMASGKRVKLENMPSGIQEITALRNGYLFGQSFSQDKLKGNDLWFARVSDSGQVSQAVINTGAYLRNRLNFHTGSDGWLRPSISERAGDSNSGRTMLIRPDSFFMSVTEAMELFCGFAMADVQISPDGRNPCERHGLLQIPAPTKSSAQ